MKYTLNCSSTVGCHVGNWFNLHFSIYMENPSSHICIYFRVYSRILSFFLGIRPCSTYLVCDTCYGLDFFTTLRLWHPKWTSFFAFLFLIGKGPNTLLWDIVVPPVPASMSSLNGFWTTFSGKEGKKKEFSKCSLAQFCPQEGRYPSTQV
jgi:hypothetical protein